MTHSQIKLIENFDWKAIQDFHDKGGKWREISEKFKISQFMLAKAQKMGIFKSRTAKEAQIARALKGNYKRHSVETKLKISEARKKYIKETGIAAWKTHDKFKSQPCEWLKKELSDRGFYFAEELQPLLYKNRFFSLDIAFEKERFAIEINGNQHYDTNGNLKPYYQNRHNLITEDGWIIWEVKYSETRKTTFLSEVQEKLFSLGIFGTGEKVIPYKPEKNLKFLDRKINNKKDEVKIHKIRKTKRLPKEILEKLVWEKPTALLSKDYDVSDVAIAKWCKFYQIPKPPRGYWAKIVAGQSHEVAIN